MLTKISMDLSIQTNKNHLTITSGWIPALRSDAEKIRELLKEVTALLGGARLEFVIPEWDCNPDSSGILIMHLPNDTTQEES